MCTRHFGSVVTQTIRTYKTDQFPLLLIVMGKRTSNEVLNVIQGKYYLIHSKCDAFVTNVGNHTLWVFIYPYLCFHRQHNSGRADDEVNGSHGDLHSTTARGHQR